MSRINIISTTGILMAPLVFLILVMSTFGVFASASSSSVAAWNVAMPSAHQHGLDSMSDLLLARAGSDSKVLIKAKQIIRDLSSSTTCSHAPTVRLLRQCKEIKPKHEDSGSDHQLNNAESVYAISMALCEAQQARVTAPSVCQIFENMLDRPLSDSSIEIIRPSEIEACSAVLYGTPGWTSYSTYKSNSKFLCDSSRTDYQREELLQTLRDATDVIPEILDALNGHRTETLVAMMQLHETAAHVDSAQREILLQAQEHGRVQSAQLEEVFQHVEAIQEALTQAVNENSKVLDLSTEKASAVDRKLTELYASFVEAGTGLTFDLAQQLDLLSQQTTSMLNQIHNLGTQNSLDNLQATMNAVSRTSAEVARLQAAQIVTGQEVLEAFNTFKPEQLLPKWLAGLSATVIDTASILRSEGTWVVLSGVPAFVFLVFGRFRWASYVFAAYFLLRFWVPLAWGLLSAFMRSHLHAAFAFLLHPRTQVAGISLLCTFAIYCCTNRKLYAANSEFHGKQKVVAEPLEKRPKSNVKEDFERSRRACSVPLDCECA